MELKMGKEYIAILMDIYMLVFLMTDYFMNKGNYLSTMVKIMRVILLKGNSMGMENTLSLMEVRMLANTRKV